jgi:hypothetical protein
LLEKVGTLALKSNAWLLVSLRLWLTTQESLWVVVLATT